MNAAVQPPHSGVLLPAGAPSGVCIGGRAAATFYLIGHQKCATTSYAHLLLGAGLRVAARGAWCPADAPAHTWCNKELHLFDGLFCGAHTASSGVPYSCAGVSADTAARQRFAQHSLFSCNDSPDVTLADFTPSYARIAGLPRLMAELHGPADARRLAFVVMLREPLARMQSGYYDDPSLTAYNFTQYAQSVAAALPRDYAGVRANASALGVRPDLDHWYRSMYGLSLSPWLTHYHPSQMLILPTHWALGHVRESVRLIRTHFPEVRLDADAVADEPPALNAAGTPHRHPDDDLPRDMADRFRHAYFEPDLELLASSIVALPRGLAVGGLAAAELERGDEVQRAAAVVAHLRASW